MSSEWLGLMSEGLPQSSNGNRSPTVNRRGLIFTSSDVFERSRQVRVGIAVSDRDSSNSRARVAARSIVPSAV